MAPPVAQTGAGNVTTAAIGSGSSVTVGKPASLADRDLLVAAVNHHIGGGTWSTVPPGWEAVTTFDTGRTAGIWVKPVPSAAAETAADYTWATTGTGSGRMGALIGRVTGADLAAPVDAAGVWQAALGATGITTTRPDCLLLGAYWSYIAAAPNAVDPPPGMSAVGGWSVSPSSSSTHLLAAEPLAAAGATGPRTATATPPGSSNLSVLVAVAAPVVGAAALTQSSVLQATVLDIPEGAAHLTQTAVLGAAGTVPDPDLAGAAALAQRAVLVVADPGQPRILAAGVWRPYISRRLKGGAWIEEN